MIGYNYNNLKITAENHVDLLAKQDDVIHTLDTIALKLLQETSFTISYLRLLNSNGFILFAKDNDNINLFRYSKGSLYDNISIKEITELFEDDAFVNAVISNTNISLKVLPKEIINTIGSYKKPAFYTTEDFSGKTEEDFEIDNYDNDGFDPADDD